MSIDLQKGRKGSLHCRRRTTNTCLWCPDCVWFRFPGSRELCCAGRPPNPFTVLVYPGAGPEATLLPRHGERTRGERHRFLLAGTERSLCVHCFISCRLTSSVSRQKRDSASLEILSAARLPPVGSGPRKGYAMFGLTLLWTSALATCVAGPTLAKRVLGYG